MASTSKDASKAIKETCPVCCLAYTECRRVQVRCAHCEFAACQECYRTYVTSTMQDPHCMNCRRAWTRDQVMRTFPTAWLNGEFKKHRELVLVERERQALPETQALIPTYLEIRRIRENLPPKIERLEAIRAEMRRLALQIDQDQYNASRMERALFRGDIKAVKSKRHGFLCPCPVDSCRGFMDAGMKCGVCEATACQDCGVLLGPEPHACDPNTVLNFQAIKRQTRPCPKCAVPTFKISGCSQMWCTACHATWDWNTGEIVTGVIHNPHYFQYLRDRSANGDIPRQPGDVPGGDACRGHNWPSMTTVHLRLEDAFLERIDGFVGHPQLAPGYDEFKVKRDRIYTIMRQLLHLSEIEIPALRHRYRRTDNLDLRLRYLVNEIQDDEFKTVVQRREKKREKDLAVRDVYELAVDIGRDAIWDLVERRASYDKVEEDLVAVGTYANQQLQHISGQYKMKAQLIKLEPSNSSRRRL